MLVEQSGPAIDRAGKRCHFTLVEIRYAIRIAVTAVGRQRFDIVGHAVFVAVEFFRERGFGLADSVSVDLGTGISTFAGTISGSSPAVRDVFLAFEQMRVVEAPGNFVRPY